MKPHYYRTRDLAKAIGQSRRTVQLFLHARFPGHVGWWIFTEQEYLTLLAELQEGDKSRRYGNRRRRTAQNPKSPVE